jgi:zinc transporter 1/2/3
MRSGVNLAFVICAAACLINVSVSVGVFGVKSRIATRSGNRIPPADASSTRTTGRSALADLRAGGAQELVQASTQLQTQKLLVQGALTLFNVVCWAVPLWSKRFTQNKELLSLANAFAGGIFLMLSFGHLLPEAVSTMAQSRTESKTNVLVYTLAGFTAMLFIEKIAFAFKTGTSDSPPVHPYTEYMNTAEVKQSLALNSRAQSAIALCSAMSVHSFFESAALGLTTDTTSMYMMAACIALHQPAESLALLVSFLKSGLSVRAIALCLTAFSAVSLIGMSAGMVAKTMASGATEAAIMAVTAGTFVYVGATEVCCRLLWSQLGWKCFAVVS